MLVCQANNKCGKWPILRKVFVVLAFSLAVFLSLSLSLSVIAAASLDFSGASEDGGAEDGQNHVPEKNLPTDAKKPVGSSALLDDPSFSFRRFFPDWVFGGDDASSSFLESSATLDSFFALERVTVSTGMMEFASGRMSYVMARHQNKEK